MTRLGEMASFDTIESEVKVVEDIPVRVRHAEGFDRFIRHCARYRLLASPSYPRGVFKFTSLVEAQAARDRITRENIRRRQHTE